MGSSREGSRYASIRGLQLARSVWFFGPVWGWLIDHRIRIASVRGASTVVSHRTTGTYLLLEGNRKRTETLQLVELYGRALGPFRPLGGSSLATELVPVPSSTDGPDSMLSLQALARNFLLRNNLISLSEPSPQEEGQDASFTVTPRVPRYNALL